jgi:ABC-type dipeptide/oligopeptide/nickel transport system permease component
MKLAITIWALLFAITIGVFFLWASWPRQPDDVEAYLLPAAFLLLAAWGQIMRLQAMLEVVRKEWDGIVKKAGPGGGVSSFNRMFEKYGSKGHRT